MVGRPAATRKSEAACSTVGPWVMFMNGKDDYALMAQWLWLEGGPILNSDLGNLAGYVEDLHRIGSAILNMWLVDNEMVRVYDAQGRRAAPLGSFGHRTLKQLILAPSYARDANGALFDSKGNMRQAFRNTLNSILRTDINRGPLIRDVGGTMNNRDCEGVIQSLLETSKLMTGTSARYTGPGDTLILFGIERRLTIQKTFRAVLAMSGSHQCAQLATHFGA
jgi:hypothetical protein